MPDGANEVRKTGTWMQQLDERILEHLREEGWSSPRIMRSRQDFQCLGTSEGTIAERCRVLASAEFVAPIHGEMYELTTWGRLYLDGDLDAQHLRPCPSRAPKRS
jgi:hypothetical protein